MNLFEQIKEKSSRMAQMLEAGAVVQQELTTLIDEINGKLGPIVSLFNAPQAAVLAAVAERTTRRGRKAKAPRSVSNDTNGGTPKRRKGAALGRADVEAVLLELGGADRTEIAVALKSRGVKLPLAKIKQLVSQILAPCNSKGRFVRDESGSYRVAGDPIGVGPRAAKSSRRPYKKRSVAASVSEPFIGSRRAELEQVIVERLEGQTKSAGQLANECAPLFPLAGKRAVADAINEILVEDKGRRFVGTPAGDWRLA
jgi:hypothetical protein